MSLSLYRVWDSLSDEILLAIFALTVQVTRITHFSSGLSNRNPVHLLTLILPLPGSYGLMEGAIHVPEGSVSILTDISDLVHRVCWACSWR